METLSIYTVYDSPDDCPGKIVVRRFEITPYGPKATLDFQVHDTLQQARDPLSQRGLYRIPRNEQDMPSVVESWV